MLPAREQESAPRRTSLLLRTSLSALDVKFPADLTLGWSAER
jgi:hypothetical protein